MLDLARLQAIHLHTRPLGQLLMAEGVLRWNYGWRGRTEIVIEGIEHLPRNRSVFLAMNHTDSYNYWPLQYAMHRRGLPYTATWVKGKYYEKALVARFLDSMNNIPMPSRGYVITTLFRKVNARTPKEAEYRFLRDLVDGVTDSTGSPPEQQSPAVRKVLDQHGGTSAAYLQWFDGYFGALIGEVVRLNREAISELGLNVLVFPQGTRSKRLSRGHTGMVQMAMHLGADIVPVGCNGSDLVYPGGSPVAKAGRIVYRFGAPLVWSGPELAPHRVTTPYLPLTQAASTAHGKAFRAVTDLLIERINGLLDPPYQLADGSSDGVRGMDRFV